MAGNQLSQLPIEVIVLSSVPVSFSISQLPLEVLVEIGPPNLRVTQTAVEILSSTGTSADVRVTQVAVELLTPNIAIAGGEFVQFYIVMP